MSYCGHVIQVAEVTARAVVSLPQYRWLCACGARQFRPSETRADAQRLAAIHVRRECPDPAHREEGS